MKIKYAIVIILLLLQPLLAQTLLWDEVFSGTGSMTEWLADAIIDNNLNVYVTGKTSWSSSHSGDRITTFKYDKNGDSVWLNIINVSGTNDCGKSICLDDSGNAYVAGFADSAGVRRLVVRKYDDSDSGAIVWNTVLIQGSYQGYYDYKIAVDNDSGVYVATKYYSDCWLLKFDSDDGDIVWDRTYNAGNNEGWCDMALDNQGYIYVGGTIVLGESDEAFVVAKYEPDYGDTVWLDKYGYDNETGCDAIDIDNAGNVYIGGTSRTGGQHATVFKCDGAKGDSLWQYHYNGSSGCDDIAVYPTGESYITSWRYRGIGNTNVLTIAVDNSGNAIWCAEFGGSSRDVGYELGIGTYCVYVGGYTSSDMLTLCYRRNNGYLEWAETYDSAKSYNIAVRPAPRPHASYITHIVSAGRKANDWVTLMYKYDESIMRSPSSGPQDSKTQLVKFFSFEKLYPNPARDILKIRFNSPDERKITIKLYDATGRLVKDIFDGNAKIGMNEISHESKNLPDGVYFVRLETAGYQVTEKVIYQK